MKTSQIFVGTAGWTVPARYAGDFKPRGSHLERYASRFNGVEINSSFYRPHRRATYERWARTVPEQFRFAVKVPKDITHLRRLADCEELLHRFAGEAGGLGNKLGVVLVQLPPSLEFDSSTVDVFLSQVKQSLRDQCLAGAEVACEPRHPSWFERAADDLLTRHHVARVAADPQCVPAAGAPGGWDGMVYYRMHGSPRMYYSNYDDQAIKQLRQQLSQSHSRGAMAWCIFDNTAEQAATGNALSLAGW